MAKKRIYMEDEVLGRILRRVRAVRRSSPEWRLLRAIFGEPTLKVDEVYTAAYLLSHRPDQDLDAYIEAAASWVGSRIDGELEKMAGVRSAIEESLQTIAPREVRVLTLRFGLDGHAPRTLEEVGREFSVQRERIRQIEAKALRKLRHPYRSHRLKEWLVYSDAIFDACVDRKKLWGLAWWVEQWLGAREYRVELEMKRLARELKDRDEKISCLELELDRAVSTIEDMKVRALGELPQPASLKEMRVEQLGLPVRIVNALRHAQVYTLGDYLLLGEEVANIRGLGAKSLELLRVRLEEIEKEKGC